MADWRNSIHCLAIKIILLGIVNEKPEAPVLNTPAAFSAQGSGRTLSLKHEISITQQLAFICAYSEDPLHVIAVCIEEARSREGLIFRVAANTGTHEGLIQSLQKIARILQDEAGNGTSFALWSLLTAITNCIN